MIYMITPSWMAKRRDEKGWRGVYVAGVSGVAELLLALEGYDEANRDEPGIRGVWGG
jgi:hypothetical protein